MKVFIVIAHPEPHSLNHALHHVAVTELSALGHTVKVSDLYAMNWKSQIDRSDFPSHPATEPLDVTMTSYAATLSDQLTADVKAEQEKLRWADILILQFPLWWYQMPAIMKGWVDRVYSCGFAYGVGKYDDSHQGSRYGEGNMKGKRAMLLITIGSGGEAYAPRGICGPIDDVLFPINHGVLYYPGFDVLPPFIMWHAMRPREGVFEQEAERLRKRMREIGTTEPIKYRMQNGGDSELPSLLLKPGLEDPGVTGMALHVRASGGKKG